MNTKEADDFQRRKLALEKAVESRVDGDPPSKVIARAEAYDAFLRGEKVERAG